VDKLPRPAAALFERFTALSDREQLMTYTAIRDYLGAANHQSETATELDERAKAVELVLTVAASYGLEDPRQLSVKDFDAASQRIRGGWKSGRVISAWGKWRFAREAAAGERSRLTARQVAIRRAVGARHLRSDDYIAALRIWFRTDPPKLGLIEYDQWRREEAERHPGELSYPSYASCREALGLSWKEMLRVARGEVTLARARKARARAARPSFSRGKHHFLSPIEIVARTAEPMSTVQRWIGQPGFPEPALVIAKRRFWLAEDVDAFVAGRPVAKRRRNELGHLYVNSPGAAAVLGMSLPGLWQLKPRLKPIAQVGGQFLYLRKDVEARRDERKRLSLKRGRPRVNRRPASR
jgi:hypothetical protein